LNFAKQGFLIFAILVMLIGGNGIIHDTGMSDKNQNAAFSEFAVKYFDCSDSKAEGMFILSIMERNLL